MNIFSALFPSAIRLGLWPLLAVILWPHDYTSMPMSRRVLFEYRHTAALGVAFIVWMLGQHYRPWPGRMPCEMQTDNIAPCIAGIIEQRAPSASSFIEYSYESVWLIAPFLSVWGLICLVGRNATENSSGRLS